LPQYHPQHRRKSQHQQDVKRQHVHVYRLELENEAFVQCFRGPLYECPHVELVEEPRIVGSLTEISDLGEINNEKKDVRHIELPRALEDASARHKGAALQHHPRVDEGRRITGNEDE
jgi:hypothetical protein